ncbi:hypothetical protein BJY00DRAFT_294548 [Aspergillus carlsbadensis]|nr:hypothetical protein BJY00DRAFT_294548 [Aspergillus carlsbadensis]
MAQRRPLTRLRHSSWSSAGTTLRRTLSSLIIIMPPITPIPRHNDTSDFSSDSDNSSSTPLPPTPNAHAPPQQAHPYPVSPNPASRKPNRNPKIHPPHAATAPTR